MKAEGRDIDIMEYRWLINYVIFRYGLHTHPDREDLLMAGYVGLLEARNRYDAGMGSKFSTYAYYWVKKRVLEEARMLGRGLSADGVETGTWEDIEASIIDEETYRSMLSNLTPEEREVVECFIEHDSDLRATARALGKDVEFCEVAIRKASKEIQRWMKGLSGL